MKNTYPIIASIQNEDELIEKFKELWNISVNLREKQKAWNTYYGAELKSGKVYWENKMDEFIDNLKK